MKYSITKKLTPGLCILFYSFLFLFSVNSYAQVGQLSPAMKEQFKNMSVEDQQQLAKQYGIDIGQMGMSGMQNFDAFSSLGTTEIIASEVAEDSNSGLILSPPQNEGRFSLEPVSIFEKDYQDINLLPRFGEKLFNKDVVTFSQIDNAPVPRDYLLGTGDTLNVLMFGNENSESILTVDREGVINFPLIGGISVAGLSFIEARDLIKKRISEQMIGVEVSVSMGRLRSIDVFLSGEVIAPGNYSVSGLATAMQLIYSAGGLSDIGSYRNIQIRRNGSLISLLDVYNLLINGDKKGDIRLQSGDNIFIPIVEREVSIEGAVRRPGRYELRKNDVLKDVLRFSGGMTSRAYKNKILIERYDSNKNLPETFNLDLSNDSNYDFDLKDGDIIRFAEVSSTPYNHIKVIGAATRPGNYSWYEGIRFTDIISDIHSDLLDTSDITFSLIMRRSSQYSRDIVSIGVNLSEAIRSPESSKNIILEPYDQVFIFDTFDYDEIRDINTISVLECEKNQINKAYNQYLNPQMRTQSYPCMMNSLQRSNQVPDTLETNIYDDMNLGQLENAYQQLNRISNMRAMLLEPVLLKLREQAVYNSPVKTVSISGAIRFPGEYPILKNNSVTQLLRMAGGLKDEALLDGVEIRRVSTATGETATMEYIELDLSDENQLNEEQDILLQSRDHVRVNSMPDWNPVDTIELSGEILHPGLYLIGDNERLSSIIARAGGLTRESFPQGAIFARESVRETETQQLITLTNDIRRDQVSRSLTKEADSVSYNMQNIEASIDGLLDIEVGGRLIVDLDGIMSGNNLADIIVQGGDTFYVPKKSNAVTVVGEVRRTGSFVYKEKLKYLDYIDLSAGITDRADNKAIYIIKANGSVERISSKSNKWLNFSSSRIGDIAAGDTIVVPLKSSYQTPLNLYSQVSSVVFQSLASIAAFFQIAK